MKEIKLNGAKMTDKERTHAYLKRELALPDYYGNNLDALWDCLTRDVSFGKITLYNAKLLLNNMGLYGESLIKVFEDLAKESSCLVVEIENEDYEEHKEI